MERIITSLVAIYTLVCVIQCLPINNGFSVKFNPLKLKEDVKPRTFGALFAKIPQALTAEAKLRRLVISKSFYPNPPALGAGCTNQVAKILFPLKNYTDDNNETRVNEAVNYINLPILKQPFEDYKILVATAPPNVKVNNDENDTPLVVYIVFPGDTNDDPNSMNIPIIYFVSEQNVKMDINKKEKLEPILIVDSNRTVTGIRSKEIEKFLKFKNKLTNRYDYQITR